jgi:hypothetical protein
MEQAIWTLFSDPTIPCSRIHFVPFGTQNRVLGPYLVTMNRIFSPVVMAGSTHLQHLESGTLGQIDMPWTTSIPQVPQA